jgi:hypothetical protein
VVVGGAVDLIMDILQFIPQVYIIAGRNRKHGEEEASKNTRARSLRRGVPVVYGNKSNNTVRGQTSARGCRRLDEGGRVV